MKRFWRYVQFWFVLLFAGAALCVVIASLREIAGKQ